MVIMFEPTKPTKRCEKKQQQHKTSQQKPKGKQTFQKKTKNA